MKTEETNNNKTQNDEDDLDSREKMLDIESSSSISSNNPPGFYGDEIENEIEKKNKLFK